VDDAEVRHLGHAPVLVGGRVGHAGEHRVHGVVDPNVDGTEFRLEVLGRSVDCRGVGHVGDIVGHPAA
jgi:hypothetical protein